MMKYLRACAICNNYFPPTDWLCSLCWKAVEREYLSSGYIYRTEKNLPHLRLLDWHEDNQQIIRPLIHSLKQGGPEFIFRRLGLEMFSRFIHLKLWDKKTQPIFVPSPARLKNKKDHALKLAESLSFYFGGRVENLLEKDTDSSMQKKKSRRERAQICIKSPFPVPKNQTFVFVDDVLTTGATASSAFQALNRPDKFFIFSLAWKRPLTRKPENEFLHNFKRRRTENRISLKQKI